jgi:hypothetical protein
MSTIAVDKRHIIALGERLYKESVDLIRELINNAWLSRVKASC